MIINSQRTLYGLELQADMLIRGTYSPKPNTTLNEKFNHLINEELPPSPEYLIKYLAIGVGGSKVATNTNSYSYSQHSPLDAALFDQLPFVLRRTDQDLLPEEQAKYRMKQLVTIDGVSYYSYMLKVINDADITTNTYTITLGANNTSNLSIFTTDTAERLNPTPRDPNLTLTQDSKYVSKLVKIRFSLTPSELEEFNNVIAIMRPNITDLNITEIGVCGGVEKTLSNGNDALNVQIYYHVGVDIDTRLEYDPVIGYNRAIELGGAEPIHA